MVNAGNIWNHWIFGAPHFHMGSLTLLTESIKVNIGVYDYYSGLH